MKNLKNLEAYAESEIWKIKFQLAFDILFDLDHPGKWMGVNSEFNRRTLELVEKKSLNYLVSLRESVMRII